MNEGHHDLDIVIVSFNCADLVEACLTSLERHPLRGGEMRVHLANTAEDIEAALLEGTLEAAENWEREPT